MKKILLATTILAMSAGYAAADIAWGGSAAAGIASNGTANAGLADPNAFGKTDDEFHTYSNVNLAATFSGTSDSGLTFGATFDMTAGTSYALADDDGFDSNGGSFGMPTIYVEGSFGKLSISDDNMSTYNSDVTDGDTFDAAYEGTFGAFTVGVMANIDTSAMGVKVGYTTGNLSLSADYNQDTLAGNDDLWDVSVGYTMGSIAVTLGASNDNTGFATEETLEVAYTGGNGITASATYNTSDSSVDIAAGYSANGLSVNADTNTVSNHWTVTAGYDLGGGLSVEAGTNYTQDMMIGAKMSF